MTAPYEEREGWEMTVVPLAGSIYMEQHDPPEAKAKRYGLHVPVSRIQQDTNVRRKEQSSWALQTYMGYAYESYSTIPSSASNEDQGGGEEDPEGWSGNVNTNVQVRENCGLKGFMAQMRGWGGIAADGSGASTYLPERGRERRELSKVLCERLLGISRSA